jgi:hypothetical protein
LWGRARRKKADASNNHAIQWNEEGKVSIKDKESPERNATIYHIPP